MDAIRIGKSQKGRHQCYAEQRGDWVIFRCPHCPDFERRMNYKTGEVKSKYNADNFNLHDGFFIRPGFDTGELYRPN